MFRFLAKAVLLGLAVGASAAISFAVLRDDPQRVAEDQAAERARVEAHAACDEKVAAELPGAVALQPRSSDPSCRDWTTDFLRVALRTKCRGESATAELMASCAYVKKLARFCPAEEWPVDMRNKKLLDLCDVG